MGVLSARKVHLTLYCCVPRCWESYTLTLLLSRKRFRRTRGLYQRTGRVFHTTCSGASNGRESILRPLDQAAYSKSPHWHRNHPHQPILMLTSQIRKALVRTLPPRKYSPERMLSQSKQGIVILHEMNLCRIFHFLEDYDKTKHQRSQYRLHD